ncbi:ABC transporter permease [Lignipirellula cremea]|uniref:Lipoprotein-releasing system transmembrane protein LolE n=1 Tax=Lignipirellula cremea TaxID=2528010 RepID=A0A518DM72_9BACT|nr:ABC transporter permease [Lignipirellula cremea]QDU92940.1 Lipoprotein-releasing system transmembrane protein LolE [Lignipirellula cremea]
MYKLLLSWRYLCTRYIALASIISVVLGVATLIVVNSVMAGFGAEMHKRLHDILSDVVVQSAGLDGIPNPELHMKEIAEVLGDDLAGMTPIVRVPAMLNFRYRGRWITQQVVLIGVDEKSYANVGDFSKYLLHPKNQENVGFSLHENGYNERLGDAGWEHRRNRVHYERSYESSFTEPAPYTMQAEEGDQRFADLPDELPGEFPSGEAPSGETAPDDAPVDPFRAGNPTPQAGRTFDDLTQQHTGVILGIAVASTRFTNPESGESQEWFLCKPGDDVQITLPTAGTPPKPVDGLFTVVDMYESKMSEYDSTFVFMPLEKLQRMRGMIDPISGVASVTSIQIRLKPKADLNAARDALRKRFPPQDYPYQVQTWKEMQGPLLAAVQLETTLLNILLFLIIAVAGFGILATFFMIVVEKTRDIGILKSLGAPSMGVMSIFLSYGLALGVVGSGVGVVMGLLFVAYINDIAEVLEMVTGREVFDPNVYYFQTIPTIIDPMTVVWVSFGAISIAVLASVLPALRAARLHPVEALRYE